MAERTAKEILDTERELLVQRIKVKKQNLILYMEQVVDGLTTSIYLLNNSLDDPMSQAQMTMFGEIQNSSRLESYVGQVVSLVEVYKELQGGE